MPRVPPATRNLKAESESDFALARGRIAWPHCGFWPFRPRQHLPDRVRPLSRAPAADSGRDARPPGAARALILPVRLGVPLQTAARTLEPVEKEWCRLQARSVHPTRRPPAWILPPKLCPGRLKAQGWKLPTSPKCPGRQAAQPARRSPSPAAAAPGSSAGRWPTPGQWKEKPPLRRWPCSCHAPRYSLRRSH